MNRQPNSWICSHRLVYTVSKSNNAFHGFLLVWVSLFSKKRQKVLSLIIHRRLLLLLKW